MAAEPAEERGQAHDAVCAERRIGECPASPSALTRTGSVAFSPDEIVTTTRPSASS
jgi:hypothetical protein